MDAYELSELITNKVMYRTGEMVLMLGLFITAIGAVMMIYNIVDVPVKKEMDIV